MQHALTRVGDDFNRRTYYRRDANCPAALIYRHAGAGGFAKANAWVSNISEGGVLLLVEGLVREIAELYVVLPGLRAKIAGKPARQGDFTVAVEFDCPLATALVDRIAAMEPKPAQPKAERPA